MNDLEKKARELLAEQVEDAAVKALIMGSPLEGSMVNLGCAVRAIKTVLKGEV